MAPQGTSSPQGWVGRLQTLGGRQNIEKIIQAIYWPMISCKCSKEVDPMIGAVTWSLAMIQAKDTCAMEIPRFLAISSTRSTIVEVAPLLE